MNICVFGDSVAKGVVFDETKNKYTFLKDCFINLVQEDTDIPFKNFAKFGCTTVKGSEIMKKQEDNLSDYEYTLLEFGGNDCDLNWIEVAKTPEDDHDAQVPMDSFRNLYSTMIMKVRAAGSKPVLLSLPPLDADRFFNWVSKGLDKQNILDFLGGDKEYIFKWHESYNDMVFEIASEYGVPVIDIRKEFLAKKNYKDLLCIDGMHPNRNGHKLIARCLGKAVRELAMEPALSATA